MTILLVPISLIALRLLLLYLRVRKSGYKSVSGNSFFRTVYNRGNYGEFLTFEMLQKVPGDKKILTNIYIPKSNGNTTELDLVMINAKGIFVFESKNYSGWIFGNEKSRMWTQTLQRGGKNKFFNPVWQNKGHITAMINLLGDAYSEKIYSYIVFSERCTLKEVSVFSRNVHVIKREQLLHEIQNNHWPMMLKENDIDLIYQTLKSHTLVEKSVKDKHKENVAKLKY
ncbi:MAG: nuclease-related domain-containing protein [Eubacteriales bacterium]|nr:nuclease-related domain-containing protein [Eubacteriales bacterium]